MREATDACTPMASLLFYIQESVVFVVLICIFLFSKEEDTCKSNDNSRKYSG